MTSVQLRYVSWDQGRDYHENPCIHLTWTNVQTSIENHPDNKVHGANMGPIWGRQDPGGPHVGNINFTIWAWK